MICCVSGAFAMRYTSSREVIRIEYIPPEDLRQEDGAHELATSPDMQPYLQFAKAVVQ
jgi:hypothetical protein